MKEDTSDPFIEEMHRRDRDNDTLPVSNSGDTLRLPGRSVKVSFPSKKELRRMCRGDGTATLSMLSL